MPEMNAPKDGDFSNYLDSLTKREGEFGFESEAHKNVNLAQKPPAEVQTIQQVLVEGQEPTDKFIEEFNALNEAPEVSDEELERQALSAPGDDGDIHTPE